MALQRDTRRIGRAAVVQQAVPDAAQIVAFGLPFEPRQQVGVAFGFVQQRPQVLGGELAKRGELADLPGRHVDFRLDVVSGRRVIGQNDLMRNSQGPQDLAQLAVVTHIADSVVADSAPAATAFATGQQTSDKVIGMGPKRATLPGVPQPGPELQYRPLATVLEGARLSGKATGVIATSRISHATPAAYAAHVPSRSLENDIMEQLVYQGVDVVLGGGRDQLLPLSAQGKRADGEDLRQVLKQSGYQLPETREALAEVKPGKVFGMFASGPLSPELDRPQLRPQEPTLAEMTAKAIELLTANPHGFFLVVEGSQIDWACHANDPAHLISDLLAFDDAVRVALDFAKRDGQTLLLAVPDHNTGGLTIGNFRTDATYSQMQIGDLLDPLRQMRRSSSGIWDQLCGGREREAVKAESIDPRDVQRVVLEHWSVTIDLEEAREIWPWRHRCHPSWLTGGWAELSRARPR
jgi:alkaline phosphatase